MIVRLSHFIEKIFVLSWALVITMSFVPCFGDVNSAFTTTTSGGGRSLAFEDWVVLHQKKYLSSDDIAARKIIYENNCQTWDLLSRVPGGASFGPEREPHADLTPEEFVQAVANCASGLPVAAEEEEEEEDATAATSGDALMDIQLHTKTTGTKQKQRRRRQAKESDNRSIVYVDWRNKDGISYVTPPKNQGAHGTCWSFAAAENLEGLNVRQGYPLVNISEQEFISCCAECQGRSQEITFQWLVNATGGKPALEESYPYDGNANVTCHVQDAPRAKVQLHSWGRIQDDSTGVPVLLGLGRHGPMSLGVDARCFFGYKGGIIRNCTATHGHGQRNHAVLMVAAGAEDVVDDHGKHNYVDYFTIKNSWSSRFGEGGYVRIEQGKNWWGPVDVIYTK